MIDVYAQIEIAHTLLDNEFNAFLDSFLDSLGGLAASLHPDQVTILARTLYWDTDIPAKRLCDRLGLKDVRHLLKSVEPIQISLICKNCGEEHLETVGSRTARAERLTYFRREQCAVCDKKQRKRYLDRIKQSNKEPEQKHVRQEARLQELKDMPYREYLRSQEWAKTRERALRLAGFRCRVCNGSSRLNVHHRSYERLGEEWDSDLTVLCKGCHGTFHNVMESGPSPHISDTDIQTAREHPGGSETE